MLGAERRVPVTPSSSSSSSSRYQRRRSTGSRDERYRSGKIKAGLWLPYIEQSFEINQLNFISLLHKCVKFYFLYSLHQMCIQKPFRPHWRDTARERWPCCCRPSGGRSSDKPQWTPTRLQVCSCSRLYASVQYVCVTAVSPCVCADSSSGSDAEGSLGRAGGVNVDSWISRALHGSPSTSSSSSSHSNSSANAARLAETSMHSYGSKSACKYTNLQVIDLKI